MNIPESNAMEDDLNPKGTHSYYVNYMYDSTSVTIDQRFRLLLANMDVGGGDFHIKVHKCQWKGPFVLAHGSNHSCGV